MKELIFIGLFLTSFLAFGGQEKNSNADKKPITDTAALFKSLNAWLDNLSEFGVSGDKDSIRINAEVKRLLQDSVYSKAFYPKEYNWPYTIALLNAYELKGAFWSMINMFGRDTMSNRIILETVLTYDQAIDMEKALTASFYTFSFADPEIGSVQNNRFMVTKPELMEYKFNQMKGMVEYIRYYRKLMNKKEEDKQNGSPN